MATALEWIKSKATPLQTEILDFIDDDGRARKVEVRSKAFRGTLPYRMIAQLKRAKLTNTDSVRETLHLGGQYKSDQCRCEYMLTEYTDI